MSLEEFEAREREMVETLANAFMSLPYQDFRSFIQGLQSGPQGEQE